jgi:outer membrane immunogenic protein
MKRALIALLVSIVQAGTALAADLPLPAPLPSTSYFPSALYNWGGGYIGLNGGYAFGASDWTLGAASTGSFQTNGFLFGGQLGWNFQYGRVVGGLEGDIDWSGLSSSTSSGFCAPLGGPAGFGGPCQTKSDWLSTARGRAGYAFDRILLFATGGLALANVQLAITTPAGSVSNVEAGWTVGAGIEYAFADMWTAKLEYLFVDFGKFTCQGVGPVATACMGLGGGSVTLTENVIRGGVNFKFEW